MVSVKLNEPFTVLGAMPRTREARVGRKLDALHSRVRVQSKTGFPQLSGRAAALRQAASKMARADTKRLLLILLATAARALLPPRQHRISMRRAPPCQPKRRRPHQTPQRARRQRDRRPRSTASKDETVGKQGAVIVDAEAECVEGAAGPAAAAEPQPPAMDACLGFVAVAAPPTRTKTKKDKKRQQAKSPQGDKGRRRHPRPIAATAPVPTTLFGSAPRARLGGLAPARGGRGRRRGGPRRREAASGARVAPLARRSSGAVNAAPGLARRRRGASCSRPRPSSCRRPRRGCPHLVSAHARAGAAARVVWRVARRRAQGLARRAAVARGAALPLVGPEPPAPRRRGAARPRRRGGDGSRADGLRRAPRGAAAADGARGRVRWFCSRRLRPAPRLREGPRAAPPAARRARGGGRRRRRAGAGRGALVFVRSRLCVCSFHFLSDAAMASMDLRRVLPQKKIGQPSPLLSALSCI